MAPAAATAGAWRAERAAAGPLVVRCEGLARVRSVRHAFSTRDGGAAGSFDLGGPEEDCEEVVRRRGLFLAAAGLRGARPALLRQVHGARVLEVERIAAVGGGGLEADAVVAHAAAGPRGLAPAVRWADCVPVLLAEQDGRAVAAVHSGWRGTAARVVPRAVARLAERGVAPEALVAAIGPSIGPCCYEVGDEVADAVARASGGMTARVVSGRPGRRRLDLREAIRLQLEGEGVGAGSIHVAPWCTACSADLFFSYRRQGAAAGRQMACIGWPPGGPP